MDVTGLGGCPRLRSCCRKATRERLLLMGELMAAGRRGAGDHVGTEEGEAGKVAPAGFGSLAILGKRQGGPADAMEGAAEGQKGPGRGCSALRCSLRAQVTAQRGRRGWRRAAGSVPLGRRREGMWVCKADSRVWSREVEMSGRVAEMPRALPFSLALSTIHARGPSIYGDREAPGGQ